MLQSPLLYWLIHVGYTFRADGRYFVLAERHRSKDTLGVYDASDAYKLARVSPFLTVGHWQLIFR